MSKYIWFLKLKYWCLISLKNIFWSILTIYVFLNWEKCISMEFFKSFNGNNILFIIWLLMIIFTIYDIKIKGFQVDERYKAKEQQAELLTKYYESIIINEKVKGKNYKNILNDNFNMVNSQYEMNNIKANLENCQNEINNAKQKVKEISKNSNRGDI